MTCSIALSFPAASIAWRTTRRAYLSLAQRSSCASESSSVPLADRPGLGLELFVREPS